LGRGGDDLVAALAQDRDGLRADQAATQPRELMRLALTDKAILALPFTASGQQIVRDAELPGFFVMVGRRTKTFMVQGDLRQNGKRQSLRLKVGEAG
jgi:hypothetical protein